MTVPGKRELPRADTDWTAIVPVKPWHSAKTRLAMPSDVREELARAMTLDILDMLASHPNIERVVVVTADPEVSREAQSRGATVLAEQPADDPLNDAIRMGCAWAAAEGGDGPTVVVPADLAYLSGQVLASALALLAQAGRAHIPDLAGTGTTLLAASHASDITPRYGPGSSVAHAAGGFARIDSADSRARADIDQLNDLVGAWNPGRRVSQLMADIGG